jgi:hypothetical protein
MSLDYNMSAIKDYDELKTDEEFAKTNAMIWDTLATDIGHIKDEETAMKFYARAVMFSGAIMSGDPLVYTLADVFRRIGLRTNVATTSDTAFHGKLRRVLKNTMADMARWRQAAATAKAE